MAVEIAGVSFKNPVITASGTFGFGKEYNEFYNIEKLGGICVKGLTLEERKGNPPPRIAETPSGVLNSVGLQNPGIEKFLDDELVFLEKLNLAVIANIAGNTVDDYCCMAEKISESAVDMVEMNISCPNVKEGGVAFGTDREMIAKITKAVRKKCKKPLIVKLSPNVTDIASMAAAAEAEGADAVSLINTITGMAIDYKTRRPVLKNNIGGLSGPAVKPIALRMVWQVYNAVKIPIIGMGGIASFEDAVEFMLAGAALVSVGTHNFVNPFAAPDIVKDLEHYINEEKIAAKDLTGALKAW